MQPGPKLTKVQQHYRWRALMYVLGLHRTWRRRRRRHITFGEALANALRRYPSSARTEGFIEDAWKVWQKETEFCESHK